VSLEFDFSEVEALASHLEQAGRAMIPEARAVVKKGATNIKNETRAKVSHHPTWKRLAASVNYDMTGSNAVQASAEVGYDEKGQGKLGNIAEFGSSKKAPHPALIPAARAEEPRFAEAMLKAAMKTLEGL
jgi:HK97 gp10 family phage protein